MKLYVALLTLVFTQMTHAASFFDRSHNPPKPITKGEAILLLASNPKADVIRVDELEFNKDTGTLRNKKLKKN